MDVVTLVLVFLAGFVASFVGGFVGGGAGLISIPALLFLGLPPHVAIATHRFASVGLATSSIYRFSKSKKIVYKYALPLGIVAIAGSVTGAQFVVQIDEAVLSRLMGILFLVVLAFSFHKHEFGLFRKKVSRFYKVLGVFGYFLVALYDGFFGAASGFLSMYLLIFLFGLTYIEANATEKIPWFLSVISSSVIFGVYGLINYVYGLVLLGGMLIGGYLGADSALRSGDKFVRAAVSLFVVASALRLLFF